MNSTTNCSFFPPGIADDGPHRKETAMSFHLGEAARLVALAGGARGSREQPFHTDIEYYEGRADGIATVNGVSVAEARLDLARRHGFTSWALLRRHVEALRDGSEPPTPFMLAYRAVEDDDRDRLVELLDAHPGADRGARDERQRPARHGRRPRDRPPAARARRRPEPRQRLRLDEAPPGGLLEPARARAADARRGRPHRPLARAATAARRSSRRSSGGIARSSTCSASSRATCASRPAWACSS